MQVVRVAIVLTGILMIGAGVLPWLIEFSSDRIGTIQIILGVIGAIFVGVGIFQQHLGDVGVRHLAPFASFGLFIGVLESIGHLIGYDFNHTFSAWEATPVYYRQPIQPVGDVFFRRPGPETWTGKVLTTQFQSLNAIESNPYQGEKELTISYDQLGFRNADDLSDWEIVFVGDSFTELGYLLSEELVSTRVGNYLNTSVKNLGVSYTGTLTHNYYLKQYGKSKSTKHAVLVFFEGNDFKDTVSEYNQLLDYQETGKRQFRDLRQQTQTSFISASIDMLYRIVDAVRNPVNAVNAMFVFRERKVPVTLSYTPPAARDLDNASREIMREVLAAWANTARSLNVEPWLVYMPTKHRVLHGYLEYLDTAGQILRQWNPNNLSEFVQEICGKNEIRFIDSTSALREVTAAGNLPYNTVWDTHLNATGTEVVARLIAKRMVSESFFETKG